MTDEPEASGVVAGRGSRVVAGYFRGGAVGDVMPLPEALIEAASEGVRKASQCGRTHDPYSRLCGCYYWAEAALEAALAFRDESGHRAVWSAEEVAAIIEERDAKEATIRVIGVRMDVAEARVAALEAEVEPLIEALANLLDKIEAEEVYFEEPEERARAALARVRGPEPRNRNQITDTPWAGEYPTFHRGTEPAENSDD